MLGTVTIMTLRVLFYATWIRASSLRLAAAPPAGDKPGEKAATSLDAAAQFDLPVRSGIRAAGLRSWH